MNHRVFPMLLSAVLMTAGGCRSAKQTDRIGFQTDSVHETVRSVRFGRVEADSLSWRAAVRIDSVRIVLPDCVDSSRSVPQVALYGIKKRMRVAEVARTGEDYGGLHSVSEARHAAAAEETIGASSGHSGRISWKLLVFIAVCGGIVGWRIGRFSGR